MQINRRLFFATAVAASTPVAAFATGDDDIATIQRQTQELNDAVTYGRADVWARYMHDDGVYTDEEGTRSTKAEIVAQIGPLPPGISGVLATQDFQAKRAGDVIVTTYVIDEHETYHGAALHCQYRNTVTWVRAGGVWKILASQTIALRTDPPDITLAQLDDYVGTYRLSSDITYTVTRTADGLAGQQTGGRARPLKAEIRDMFFNPGRPRYRFIFVRDAGGRVDRMIERREAWDIVFRRES